MSDFVTITKSDFESFLPTDFSIFSNPMSKEVIYDIPTTDPRLVLRIYSSIDIRTEDSRNIGEDAIRCVLVDLKSTKPIDKGKRTHRMSNWKERLQEKVDTLLREVSSVKFCRTCGSAMQLRENKSGSGTFYGCMRFPICMTTMSMDGKYREATNPVAEEDDPKVVHCPRCDSLMKKRNGRLGAFYGCTKFPECKGIRKVQDVEMYGQGVDEQFAQHMEEQREQEKEEKTVSLDSLFKPPVPVNSQPRKEYNDVPMDDNVQIIDTESFPFLKFKFKQFNPVQSRVFHYYSQDINLIVAAATSAGKTTIAEMLMSDSIAKGKKAIFLSPLKAVSQEKYEDWSDNSHGWSKMKVSIVTGDYQLTEKRVKELNDANVIIMTTEMMDSRTRRIKTEKNDWLLQVGTVVIDESHLLMMKGRGDRVESAVMRFTKQNPDCRIVFLSATMPNVSELAEWLTSLNGKKTELINSNYRPCKLTKHYEGYNDIGRYADVENRKIMKAVEITQQHMEDKFIVFVHAKGTGRSIYQHLKNLGENVEIHNAELSLQDRIRVSDSFKKKDGIRIIVATSTLAWGVNLPARRVIVTGVHRGMNEVEPLDIKQECGRAGRVGFDPEGDAHVLLPESKYTRYKQWCENIPPIKSTMNDIGVLAFHIVSEICEGEVYNVESLMDWYNRSLAAFQNDMLDRIVAQELLDSLEKVKILEKKGESYKVTNLGRIASHLYFDPYTIAGWYMNFNKIFREDKDDDTSLSWALANIRQYSEGFIPKDHLDSVRNYKSRLQVKGMTLNDGQAWVGYCTECCLTYSDGVRPEEKRNVQFDMERTVTALSRIDQQYGNWGKEENYWKKLQMRIEYEITWDQTELCSLKGIGGVFVRKLFDADIKNMRQLKQSYKEAANILGISRFNKLIDENSLDIPYVEQKEESF